ncbi:MAG: hypothetical protein AABZ77_05775, partial [Chloroflexota bacterium]
AFRSGSWQQFLYPIDSVLSELSSVVVSDDEGRNIRNGRCVTLENIRTEAENRCRAYTSDGSFLAVLRFNPEDGQWYPQKVFLRSGTVLE